MGYLQLICASLAALVAFTWLLLSLAMFSRLWIGERKRMDASSSLIPGGDNLLISLFKTFWHVLALFVFTTIGVVFVIALEIWMVVFGIFFWAFNRYRAKPPPPVNYRLEEIT
jgi:hypothetical protein